MRISIRCIMQINKWTLSLSLEELWTAVGLKQQMWFDANKPVSIKRNRILLYAYWSLIPTPPANKYIS